LGLFFYNIFLILFKAGVRIAALFNAKAKKWVQGRKGLWEKLKSEVGSQKSGAAGQKPEEVHSKIIWVHCASLGEFEQGRPVIERLKSQYPNSKLLLTFFSPSGYEIRKDYKGADWVFYLPMDGSQNAKRFLEIVNPALVIFVKYEFWYYYLREIKHNNIPLLLISALFREHSVFFKWYGGLQRKMLSFFDHLFVQNETSKRLLNSIGLDNKSSVCGDTRFDRVIEIAEKFTGIPAVEEFVGNSKTIVAGSTWLEDEQVLQRTIETISDPSLKLIIAPHEINKEHIAQVQKLFPDSILFSELTGDNKQLAIDNRQLTTGNKLPASGNQHPVTGNILIIDNIGMLSRLYKYGFITYIGGGFGKGIHNTLEAAVYGKPVLFGPAYRKFNEATDLVNNGGAISINNTDDCIVAIKKLIRDDSAYTRSSEKSKDYVYTNKGATEKIMKFIQEKRLLTN
jgi:3-deoxy-D-manno-octulosonic-acid transferase